MRVYKREKTSSVCTKWQQLTLLVSHVKSRICFLKWICQSLSVVANTTMEPLIWVAAELRGIATQITRKENRGHFLHWFSHFLNLPVSDAMKNFSVWQAALETALKCQSLWITHQRKKLHLNALSQAMGRISFSPTCWTAREDSIKCIL